MTTKISQLPANQQIAWAAATPAVTVSTPLLNLTQTWNAGGVTFTGAVINVTDSASASGSLLLDLQVASSSKASVNKSGLLTISSANIGQSASATLVLGGNAVLLGEAANTLALRNGVSAQTSRVYNTFTDASNGEWGALDWSTFANILTLSTAKNGTGAGRGIRVMAASGNTVQIGNADNGGQTLVLGGSSGTLTGNLNFGAAANTVVLKQGANGSCGTFVANGATAVTVNNTNVAITDTIHFSLNTAGGTVGAYPVIKTITAATGFTVAGTAGDTSTYNYAIIKNA